MVTVDGPFGPYDPSGTTKYHVESVECLGSDLEPLQELLDKGSLYGYRTLVQCFFDTKKNSFVVIWKAA
jgi:hypothetical protein